MKKPSYKRQKALLALLDTFGERLSRTELQKLMFLYVQEYSEQEHYAFVPYHFGSFSYEMYKDLATLERNGLLSISKHHIESKIEGLFNDVSPNEQKNITRFSMKYKNLKGNELIEYVYNKYPYYAIKSKIANRFISAQKIHIPNLGIESENRKMLQTKADYDALFRAYAKTFKTKVEDMAYLNELIENEKRVAITCF